MFLAVRLPATYDRAEALDSTRLRSRFGHLNGEVVMLDSSLVEKWLDVWEDLHEKGKALALDEFIGRYCQGSPPELISRFRQQVLALKSINVKLHAAVPSPERDPGRTDFVQADTLLRPGYQPIPGHTLESRLGRGGFGEVWKAAAPGGFHIAIKFVRLERRIRTAEMRALETIKDVRHPHLLTIIGAYQQDGHLIIAMELADRTLEHRLREVQSQGLPGIPKNELLEYMVEAAKGLDYLNEVRHPAEDGTLRGIQHRDIKPGNLLLVGGSVKVGDFGLARCLNQSLISHTGSMTPSYAPPEFFKGQTSNQSDQYSLAVTYCELFGGRLPFVGTALEIMAGHTSRAPDLSMLPSQDRPVVQRALAKKPSERWPSCRAFVEALGRNAEATVPPVPVVPDLTNRPTARQEQTASGVPAARHAATVPEASSPTLAGPVETAIPRTPAIRKVVIWGVGLATVSALVVVLCLVRGRSPTTNAPGRGPSATIASSVRRGFGDTILKYQDRSYASTKWNSFRSADSLLAVAPLSEPRSAPLRLYGIIGWDDDSFWVTGHPDYWAAVIYRYQHGKWSLAAEVKSSSHNPSRQRLLSDNRLLYATHDKLYELTPNGLASLGQRDSPLVERSEICPASPNLFYLLIPDTLGKPIGSKIAGGKRSEIDGTKEALVHEGPDAPLQSRPVGNIQHMRLLAPGHGVGVHADRSGAYQEPALVELKGGIWYMVDSLPARKVVDMWVQDRDGELDFIVAVGEAGSVYTWRRGGAKHELPAPVAAGKSPPELFKVWGVGPDKFWVMDRQGAIWERNQTEWRAVVQGQETKLIDGWVSPTGTVFAISESRVLRLE